MTTTNSPSSSSAPPFPIPHAPPDPRTHGLRVAGNTNIANGHCWGIPPYVQSYTGRLAGGPTSTCTSFLRYCPHPHTHTHAHKACRTRDIPPNTEHACMEANPSFPLAACLLCVCRAAKQGTANGEASPAASQPVSQSVHQSRAQPHHADTSRAYTHPPSNRVRSVVWCIWGRRERERERENRRSISSRHCPSVKGLSTKAPRINTQAFTPLHQ